MKQYGFSALMVVVLLAAAFSHGPTRALLYLVAGSIGFEWLSRHWFVSRIVRICAYALIAIALVTSSAHLAFSGIYLTATATELGWLFIAIRHHRRWRHANFINSPPSSAL